MTLFATRRPRRPTGYTLVEMMVVLFIATILLSVAVPIVRPALERGKVNSAANIVASDLQYAMLTAVRNGKPVAFIIDGTSKQLLIRDRADASLVYRTRNLGADSDYNLGSLISTPTSNEMFPNGIARQTMTVTLSLNGFSRDVKLTRAGQVRVIR